MTSPLPEGPYHVRLGTQGMSPILKCSESSTVSTCQSEPVTPRDGRHERWATLKDAKKSLEDQLDAVQQALQELHEEKLTEAHKKAEDKATLAESLQDQLEKLTAKLDEAKRHKQATEAESKHLKIELENVRNQQAKEKKALVSASQEQLKAFISVKQQLDSLIEDHVRLQERMEAATACAPGHQEEDSMVVEDSRRPRWGSPSDLGDSQVLPGEVGPENPQAQELASRPEPAASNSPLNSEEPARGRRFRPTQNCPGPPVRAARSQTPSSPTPRSEFRVRLEQCGDRRLGMKLDNGGHVVIIDRIDEGLVKEWNNAAERSHRVPVQRHDLIVEVNRVRGDACDMIMECEKDQVLQMKILKVDGADPWSNRIYALARVSCDGGCLHRAPSNLLNDWDLALQAIGSSEGPFDALDRLANCKKSNLLRNRSFVEEAVERTRSPWLLRLPQLKHFSEDQELRNRCERAAGTGLVFTWYQSATCFMRMREYFKATGASVPGGAAYEAVMEELNRRPGGAATVWFGDEPVFGVSANGGKWQHPTTECGRDMVPVPGGKRNGKWDCKVESRTGDREPEVGSRHKCWCCRWLRRVQKMHREGYVICCTTSNIFDREWVGDEKQAGSSELSDLQARRFRQPKEDFRNGRPKRWGTGRIQIPSEEHGGDFNREAPVHERTNLPLGQGCRWERLALDGLGFPVFVFFMP
ncbi:unnamed protein product [Durusdinium trenchii]|uniref:Uncharacterized protein n=1 Tax=Durusdinium trenchii TaxID=1381693 RepID=A0ABP0HGX5_9DINO